MVDVGGRAVPPGKAAITPLALPAFTTVRFSDTAVTPVSGTPPRPRGLNVYVAPAATEAPATIRAGDSAVNWPPPACTPANAGLPPITPMRPASSTSTAAQRKYLVITFVAP